MISFRRTSRYEILSLPGVWEQGCAPASRNRDQRLGRCLRRIKTLAVSTAVAGLLLATGCGAADPGLQRVTRVFDGDTIQLANGQRVRLIGIDCPEAHESDKLYRDARRTKKDIATIQAQGRLATAFTRQQVLGRDVRLEFDQERRDTYGRLLAYVFIPSGEHSPEDLFGEEDLSDAERGVFLNGLIVAAGYATPMTIPPNTRYTDLIRRLYRSAQAAGRGLWAP